MGKIFFLMGKSASGKDTIYKELQRRLPKLRTVRMYTTRPKRDGETDGEEYYFRDTAFLEDCRKNGSLIECRTYDTVYGPWSYFTVNDGQIDRENGNYLMMGTLESFERVRSFYGEESLVPLYIWVEDGIRLQRALDREKGQREPRYRELCRRYLADEEDFSEERLEQCGIKKYYDNEDLETCLTAIMAEIYSYT